MVWFISFFTLVGFNFAFWLTVGGIRLFVENIPFVKKPKLNLRNSKIKRNDVAAIIPAHNEELTIEDTINALLKILPRKQIYVVSDQSTDKTVQIIRNLGVRSLDLRPNRGKAKCLVSIMSEYGLLSAYKLIIINDADTEIDKNYLKRALPLFNDPDIAAIAAHGIPKIKKYNFWQDYFISYRLRLWRILQFGMRFGQTWKYTNLSFIIPGALSFYRTSVLRQLEIDAPGLVIEDFNMTFEVHKKRLGKIAYSPKIFGIHQDPYAFMDYIKQIKRWNVGFFQTVKRHGIWPSFFWAATTFYYLELFLFAIFIVISPIFIIYFLTHNTSSIHIPYFYSSFGLGDLLIGLLLMDYLLTVFSATIEKKPIMLLYGLGFIFLRYIDAVIYIFSPLIAVFSKDTGTWKSPKRL